MKKNRKGFTLVELLVVITILGIILTIAIPSIFNVNKKMKQKSLDSKIEMIEKAAVIYAQNNSNSIKASIGITSCTSNIAGKCECEGTDCNYIYTITLEDLVELGAYDSEKNSNGCDVSSPMASEYCLDCSTIKIKLDDNYKTATAELTVDDTKLTTYTCS